MDCDGNAGVMPWNWQQENHFQKDTNFDISECMWAEVTQNEEDMSYMLDEATPVKACGDLAHNAAWSGNMSKEQEEYSHSYPKVKRRRMLQFDSQPMDPSLCCDETSYAFLGSDERDNSVEEAFVNAPQCYSGQQASCYDVDQSTDLWLASCLNDTDINFSQDDVNYPGTPSDVQIDISDFWNDQVNSDDTRGEQQIAQTTQKNAQTTRKIVFRGRKSSIRLPPQPASSVTYPFAFIKPCEVHGDVTLKDINQRIHTPPSQKMKQNDEDPLASYSISAFSGKPVVGKMKIHTEGGKGSITVMRTKG